MTATRIKLKHRLFAVQLKEDGHDSWWSVPYPTWQVAIHDPAALHASSSTTAYSCDPWILNNGREDLSNKGSQGLA